MVSAGFCRSCVLAIQFTESKTYPSMSWQLQRKDQRLKRKAECQKMSQDPGSSNRTYLYLADVFAALEIKLIFFFKRESYFTNREKSVRKFSPNRAYLQITGALLPHIILSDHRGGPEEYQISKWAHFFPSRERKWPPANTGAPPVKCSWPHPSQPWMTRLGSGSWACPKHLRTTGEVRMLAQCCWSFLAEGGCDWENHSRAPTSGSPAGQTHMLSGLFHTTLHSVNKMDF